MLDKLKVAIKRYDMIKAGDRVCVALSGGADSVSLLYCLLELKDEYGITLSAAHLNHNLRGEESMRDELFVKKLCKKLSVPLFCLSVDVAARAKSTHSSVELAARAARYEFFSQIPHDKIATAHSADDSLETVIFNITRGSGLKGLCGIPAKRDDIIRPLILCTRNDVEDYCRRNDIEYVTDSTNSQDCYTRNKIRHRVVPVLKSINPSVCKTVRRLCDSAASDEEYLTDTASRELKNAEVDGELDVNKLKNLHPAIISRVLRQYLFKFDTALESVHIERLIEAVKKGNGAVEINGELKIGVVGSVLKRISAAQKNIDKIYVLFSEISFAEFETRSKINNLLLNNAVDCDKICGVLKTDIRQSGDKIRLFGRGVTKTLKKLYGEMKIPQELRHELPVVRDENGPVWICGVGVAERVCVDKNTKRVLVFETNKNICFGGK